MSSERKRLNEGASGRGRKMKPVLSVLKRGEFMSNSSLIDGSERFGEGRGPGRN
jgi:hypothetical protein